MADTQNIISLCSGVGMLDEGLHTGLRHLGIESRTVAYVEWESYAASQLVALMESKCLDAAPVWCGDLAGFPFNEFRGLVHGVTAGFPCQPHSVAGKRAGLDDERWIWPAIMQGIRDCDASWVFLENVSGLATTGGLAACLVDLASAGFDVEWGTVRASDVGASHQRERIFILAVRAGRGFGELRQSSGSNGFADGGNAGLQHIDLQQRQIRNEHPRAGVIVENPSRHGGDRPHGEDRRGRGVCETGGALEHTPSQRPERRQDAGTDSGDAGPHGRGRAESGGGRIDVGDSACGSGNQNGNDLNEWARVGARGRPIYEIFAPGPSDPRWGRIIAERPWLAPATEPGVRMLVDGMAVLVDESRRNQLRAGGNGVCPLQAAFAFVTLADHFK